MNAVCVSWNWLQVAHIAGCSLGSTPEDIGERWPTLASRSIAVRWLAVQADSGRSPRTVQAYARSLVDYLAWCDRAGVEVESAGRAEIAGYLRDLRERPGRRGANVISLNSGVGLSNATLQLRVTVVRLFYDFLVEEQVRDRNPVARGYRSADGRSGRRGLVGRLDPLPWIPTDPQWRAILVVTAGESLRNRLMLALAYDAALRREELCLLETDDLDPAHRTITVRAETTKSRRSRVVPYSAVSGQLLAGYLRHRRAITTARGALFVSESPRNRAAGISPWTWSKVVRSIAVRADVSAFSTHTLRHLCLTDLARSGWELHQIATFAGHRSTDTTQRYIHLSGRDLAERLQRGMTQIHQARVSRSSARCSRDRAGGGGPHRARAAVDVVDRPSRYERTATLTEHERDALGLLEVHRYRWPAGTASALGRLIEPIDDALDVIASHPAWWGRSSTRSLLLGGAREHRLAFWGWGREQWVHTVGGANNNYRQAVAAVAYLLCDQRDLHRAFRGWKTRLLTRRVFGPGPVDGALGRVQGYLDGLGSATVLQRPNMQGALYELMLLAGSPLLEDLGEQGELLAWLRSQETNNARRYGVEQLTRTLVDMGVMARMPFATQPSREEWLDRSQAGEIDVPLVWLAWTRRWFETSPLALSTRRHTYYALIRAGRWLHSEHPDRADPKSWDRELAAGWVATVDRLKVGELSKSLNAKGMRARYGEILSPRSKASLIGSVRLFFCDLHEWEWIERRFDPRRALGIPRSIAALIGPDPRVIADEVWAKLMWAGLNLGKDDLPKHGNKGGTGAPWYPLELVRAVALLWLFAGLRVDEILRLRVGAIRWQTDVGDVDDDEERVCLLDVPTNKTSPAFTKPVDRLVGEAIEAWQAVRPGQPRFSDRKTGGLVDMLLAYRGAQLGEKYINRVLVPLLCGKAGVPGEDVRGAITSHRARATIATQLYNAKDPMSLFELQAWLGHSNPSSTQHYARITPLTLTKAYTDAGYFARNVRTIEVLVDRGAITKGQAGNGGPFEFYDLGHGYCSYSFFEQCPHRMACARCDFYLPKPSSEAQLLEARDGLQRMLVEIPLTDDERSAVEGDERAVGYLIDLLADAPTPAGPTGRELTRDASPQPEQTPTDVRRSQP